jgi:hypothetical protein
MQRARPSQDISPAEFFLRWIPEAVLRRQLKFTGSFPLTLKLQLILS